MPGALDDPVTLVDVRQAPIRSGDGDLRKVPDPEIRARCRAANKEVLTAKFSIKGLFACGNPPRNSELR
jgi:hypothetical protein